MFRVKDGRDKRKRMIVRYAVLEPYIGVLVSAENPEGASSGTARVLRGGSWYDNASSLTSSWRSSWISPSTGKENSGFRLVGNLSE